MPKNIDAPGPFGGLSVEPLKDYVPVTPSNDPLPDGPCRSILVTTAGTVNLTTKDGVDRDAVPVSQGLNILCASKIRAGGTANGFFAGY